MTLIDTVRQALRIKSTALDNEIMVLIEACKVYMAMAGVSRIDEGDPSFTAACIQYCKANFGQDSEGSTRERWEKCYKALRDSMSMSREYGCLQNSEEKAEIAPVQPQEPAEETEGSADVV